MWVSYQFSRVRLSKKCPGHYKCWSSCAFSLTLTAMETRNAMKRNWDVEELIEHFTLLPQAWWQRWQDRTAWRQGAVTIYPLQKTVKRLRKGYV